MALPFTAYLGEPADRKMAAQCADRSCACPSCGSALYARDGRVRLFPYGEHGALVAFVDCRTCSIAVAFAVIGDEAAQRTLGMRLRYEADPSFDPSRLDPLPRQFTREGIAQADDGGLLRRIDCPECAGAIPVMTEDFVDARELYAGLPGVAYLFNAPCPWCSAFFYKAVGSPKAADALYRAIEADAARRRQLH